MEIKSPNILISGSRAPIALEMARSFKEAGCKVIMMDSLHFTIARWSNAVHTYYVVPSPRFQMDLFVKKVVDIIQYEQITHFIPTCEEAVFIASQLHQFPCKVWTSELKMVLSLHHKYEFTKFATENFPVPETVLLLHFYDWENSKDWVFKPVYSRFASSVIINQQLNCHDIPDAEKPQWIAQKKIIGKEICVYSIWDQGQLKAFSAYHPLYRAGKGAGVFFEPVNDPKVLQCVEQFGRNINYTGQLSFDLILDETHTPYFIECNPRGTSGAHLLHQHLASAFLENTRFIQEEKTEYSIKYAMFLLHLPRYFSRRNRQSKDVIFKWNDIKPFLLQILSLLEITYLKFTKNITWLQASTSDIEWNGDEN